MEELSKHGNRGMAAMKADMDPKTGRKYAAAGCLPSEMARSRDWRTREDPFAEDWHEAEELLREVPGLDAKTVFEVLCERHPGRHQPGELRTLQRHVRTWRAARGPEKDVVLAQMHRPGEAAQTDFTSTGELAITVAGELFLHILCVFVLPFSNWQWATVSLSESIAALRKGIQRALFQLGRVPKYHQTDNSTAATHRIPDGKSVVVGGRRRPFNDDYLAVMRHFGMTARTTEVGAKEQNGDVEASNGALKRRLEQALLLRGNRDFESIDAWQGFIDDVQRKANAERGKRVAEELAAMRELDVSKLPEYTEETARVSEWSTIRIKRCGYSVPSRLIGEQLKVRIYEDRIEARYGEVVELACERLHGRNLRRIDYRHVIWSLVRKPGAFARYVYREEMFPSLTFRQAYDAIQTPHQGTRGDLEYLRILHLAASTMQASVETGLAQLLAAGEPPTYETVKAIVVDETKPTVPEMAAPEVDLHGYDILLGEVAP